MTIQDKAIVITGGSGGIGAAIAQALAAEGAKLVLTGRNATRLNAVAASLNTPVETVIADVTAKADCERVIQATLNAYGAVDVLINNAGYAPPAPLLDTDEALWDVTLDTCLKGVYLMTQAAVPSMLAAGGGTVIQISSLAGVNGYANRTAYCAAKWGVQGFTAALRDELGGQGIRAHTVNPAAVATAWWGNTNDAQPDDVMQKMIQPEDVAAAVRYLLIQPENLRIDEVIIQTHRSPWE